MIHVCLNCKKYVFDGQDINKFKRMTAEEYINGVIRTHLRTNTKIEQLCQDYHINVGWHINKGECELCGAPHAVMSDGNTVVKLAYFFSGGETPSEKDKRFIEHFKQEFLSR